jgi:uncharacterized membrane protein
MVSVGVLHFVAGDLFAQIVPPQLPAPLALVYLSGIAEIALGLGLVPERTRRAAGIGLVLLFIAVFPANVYMALANVQVQGLPPWLTQPSPTALWLRLPFQLLFIAWALWVSRDPRASSAAQGAEGRT